MPVCCRGSRQEWRGLSKEENGKGVSGSSERVSKSKGRQQPSVLSTQIGRKVESAAHVCTFLFPFRVSLSLFLSRLFPPFFRPRSFSLLSPTERVPRWFVCTTRRKSFQVARTNRARSRWWRPRLCLRILLYKSRTFSLAEFIIKDNFFLIFSQLYLSIIFLLFILLNIYFNIATVLKKFN